jgi:hypothetical protein
MSANTNNWVGADDGADEAVAIRQAKALIGASALGVAAVTAVVFLV